MTFGTGSPSRCVLTHASNGELLTGGTKTSESVYGFDRNGGLGIRTQPNILTKLSIPTGTIPERPASSLRNQFKTQIGDGPRPHETLQHQSEWTHKSPSDPSSGRAKINFLFALSVGIATSATSAEDTLSQGARISTTIQPAHVGEWGLPGSLTIVDSQAVFASPRSPSGGSFAVR